MGIRSKPYLIINAAMSLDGKISTRFRKQLRISSELDLDRVQKLRAWADGIMVGIGTVLADDPKLTLKDPRLIQERISKGKDPQPARIVLDSRARIPLNAQLLTQPGKVIIAATNAAPWDKLLELSSRARILIHGAARVDLPRLLDRLARMGLKRILVEGGASLNWSLISQGLVDELQVYIAPLIIGGTKAPSLVAGLGFDPTQLKKLYLVEWYQLGEGIFTRWRFADKER